MRTILFLPFLLLAMESWSQQQWEQMYPGHSYFDISSLVCWNNDTLFAAGVGWTLLRSVDEGLTWERMFHSDAGWDIRRVGSDNSCLYLLSNPSFVTYMGRSYPYDSTTYPIYKYDVRANDTACIRFPIILQGGSLMSYDLSVSDDCITVLQHYKKLALLQSTDQGQTWMSIVLSDSMDTPRLPAGKIFFANRYNGVLISYRQEYGTQVAHITTDGGASWEVIPQIDYPATLYIDVPKIPAQWINDSTLVLISGGNVPWITTDRGLTWESRPYLPATIHSIQMDEHGVGYAVGKAFVVFKTTDGWKTSVKVREPLFDPFNQPVCVMLDSDRLFIAGYWGNIISTLDGGVSWNDTYLNPLSHISTISLAFFTSNAGGCIIHDAYANTRAYHRTTDGGRTWNRVYESPPFNTIEHIDAQNAYGISPGPLTLYRTSDGGQSWSQVFRDDSLNQYGACKGIRSADTFFLATNRGILMTPDRGVSWMLRGTDVGRASDMRFRNATWMVKEDGLYLSVDDGMVWESKFRMPDSLKPQGWFSGYISASPAKVLATIDRNGIIYFVQSNDKGLSWTVKRVPSGTPYSFVQFENDVAYGLSGNRIVKTSNGWETSQHLYEFRRFNNVYAQGYFFLDSNTGWLIGRNYLLRTTNGGISWIELPLPGAKSVSLQPNYPNPVSGSNSTTIPFTVTGNREVHVRIEVHDLLGRKVATVHDKPVSPGSHSALWVTRGVSPGMYFVRIVGAESELRKVVVR